MLSFYRSSNILENKKNIINYKQRNNLIKIDGNFYCKGNNCKLSNMTELLTKGCIYHPQQLLNFDNNLLILNNNQDIYIYKDKKYVILNEYLSKIYNLSYEFHIRNIKVIHNNYNNKLNEEFYCFYIGNNKIGLEILKNLRHLKNKFVGFIFKDINNIFIKTIYSFFENYIIFKSNEYGNDIIPSLQAVNYIKENYKSVKYVYKFHTKQNNSKLICTCLDYIFNKSTSELCELINPSSNCITHPKYMMKYDNMFDVLEKKYNKYIDYNKSFCTGSFFFSKIEVYNLIYDFIKDNNYNQFFLNNMYNSHNYFKDSPIHFLERLFGVIKLPNNKEEAPPVDLNTTLCLPPNNNNEINYNKIVILHVGNLNIFKQIINDHPIIKNFNLIITYYDKSFKDKILALNLNIIKLLETENKGADCGPMLLCIKYLLTNPSLYNENTIFYKIHTKSIENWRNILIRDMLDFTPDEYYNIDKPIIFGSEEYIFSDRKGINKVYIDQIVKRTEKKTTDDYYDLNYEEFVSGSGVNKFTDLFPSLNFYKNYEPDLNHLNDLEHWYIHGVNEFHRKSNVNYIKKYAKYSNEFIAGTIFGFNKLYLDLFKKYDLHYEYSLLEKGYLKNYNPTKLHSWEYYFGLIVYMNNGFILGINKKNINIHKRKELKAKMKYSVINIPFKKPIIAMFLLIPGNSPDSGGYRTLLKYINELNKNGYSLDIYFGVCWNDKEKELNVNNMNDDGMPSCKNWLIPDDTNIIYKLIENIEKYNEIDVKKNNFYLGLKCQKNYKIIIANAWQIADAVYANKAYADKLVYIIQDIESLFYPDNKQLQDAVIKTYKKDYNYYCITQYLSNYFQKYTTPANITSSYMGVNLQIYKNINLKRENAVIIPYYKNHKPGRQPNLVREIIKKLSSNGIKCYVYPFDYETKHKNIINLGIMTETKLNKLYNKYKVGIVFSNTNPSRLGFEMYASGLHVIEYDSEFTKYDMPDKYFTKIKDQVNILNIVTELFDKPYDNSFLQSIDIRTDFKNFLKCINEL